MTLDLAKIKSDAEKIAANSDLLLMALPVKDVQWMVAEIERLMFEPAKHSRRLIEQLKAENEDYKSGQGRYEQIIEDLKAENEALKKRVDELSPFHGAPLSGQDSRCLACGGFHYGLNGLPCPNMKVTAQ